MSNKLIRFVLSILFISVYIQHVHGQAEIINPNSAIGIYWRILGNTGTSSGTNFLGTTDNASLRIRTVNLERMVIDSFGKVGIQTTTPFAPLDVAQTNGSSNLTLITTNYGNPNDIYLSRAQGTIAAPTIIGSGGTGIFARINARGYDGITYRNAAQIAFEVDAATGANDMPGRITFLTTPDGTITPVERIRIEHTGEVGIGVTNPLRLLHLGGLTNTVRIDGLATGGSFISVPAAATDKLMFADALGDVRAYNNGTTGQILTIGATGTPAWSNSVYWSITGNSGTNSGTNFIGTTDNVSWRIRTNNIERAVFDSIGQVGIKIASPQTFLDINGDYAYRVTNTIVNTVFNNNNYDLITNKFSSYRITSTYGDDFRYSGFTGGTNGRIVTLYNAAADKIDLLNESALSLPANRIITGQGGAVTLGPQGSATMQYNTFDNRWVIIALMSDDPGGNDWHLTGNSATTAGTNFIGTTDATDFVVKTAGSAATNERMRVKSAGNVTVNNTGNLASDVFSAYANNTTNGTSTSINNAVGTFAVNGYSAGSGNGVYGEVNHGLSGGGTGVWGNLYGTATTASTTSEGVWGTNATAPAGTGATAAVATGVRGEATGAAGTAFTMAVLGINTGTAGSAFGVYGQTSSPASMGVFGVNLDVSASPAHGVQGQTAAVGSAAGLRGFNTATVIGAAQNGFGVRGSANASPTGTGFVMGVRGDVAGATGSTYGLYGQSASANGFGGDAVNTNTSGTGLLVVGNNVGGTFLTNGTGAAINGAGMGTFSIAKTAASGVGVVGIGNNLVGSIIAPASGAGVSGTGTQYGIMGFATTTVGTDLLSNSALNGVNASAGGYFEVQNAGTAQTWAYVGVRDNTAVLRKIIGPGTVNTIVKDLENKLVALSCPEAPENLFQDYGQGQLINGKAHINLDPVFSKNIVVNEKHPLRVFVQLEADCNGVFVSNKTVTGFDVTELHGGTSNTPFTFTITANRADEINPDGTVAKYSSERFPPAPGPQRTTLLKTAESLDTKILNADIDMPQSALPKLVQKRSKGK